MLFGKSFQLHSARLLMAMTTALAVAWLLEPWLGLHWQTRLLVLGGCLAAAVPLFRLEVTHHAKAERTAKRYMDLLCRLDDQDLTNPQVVETLPKLDEGNAWRTIFARARDRLVDCCRRADEAEHLWTSNEVRLRRLDIEHSQLREIMDRVSDAILAINHFDEITWTNQPARELFRLQSSGTEFRKLDSVVKHRALLEVMTEARRRRSASQRSIEVELTDDAGASRWYRVTCRSLSPAQGDEPGTHGAIAVLTDLSIEKGIQKRHAEFVSATAHELKTPLASIRAYVELLLDGEAEAPETKDEFLNVINSQSERLQRLIENLLDLARIEAGVVKIDKQPLSLNDVLESAFNVVQPNAEQKPVEFVRELSPMFLGVLADRDMLMQSVINLLSNAVKYTPVGGKVILRSRIEEGASNFEVEDTGVGLSSEDCQKVFEKFYRVKKDQQMASGTGLGLPLAKHIVEDVHGGTIAVVSQLGKGSIFRVTLPKIAAKG